MSADEVALLVGDLWGPRSDMIRKLGSDYISLLKEIERCGYSYEEE
jgi:hypothetical protein